MARRIDEGQLAVARLYAGCLLDLAEEAGVGDELAEELSSLGEAIAEDASLGQFFGSPLVRDDKRRQAIEAALRGKLHDLVVDALQVMNDKGRLGLVEALSVAYEQELDARRGRFEISVTTPVPLTDELRDRLIADLVAISGGKTPKLSELVDPSILGGMVLETERRKIDYSLATHVRHLDERLEERASEAIQRAMQ